MRAWCAWLQAGFDYAPLRDALAEGDFQKADDITRAALIQLAGPGAVKRNWVYFTGEHGALYSSLVCAVCLCAQATRC